jgi:glutathione synthase
LRCPPKSPPTGIRAIAGLGGPDVAAKIWDAIENKRGGK